VRIVINVSRRSNRAEVVQKKRTVVSRRKERARVICRRGSPEGQNRAEGEGRAKKFAGVSEERRKWGVALAVSSMGDRGACGT